MNKITRFKFWVSTLFSRTRTANICKHRTKIRGWMRVFDKQEFMQMPTDDNGNPDYCLDCIGGMSIRCAWCKEAIVIGEPIIASIPLNPDFQLPENAHSFRSDCGETVVVGCLRWDCADCGGMRNGFWLPPGQVLHVPLPIQLLFGNPLGAVIVENLADPNNTGKVFPIDPPAG